MEGEDTISLDNLPEGVVWHDIARKLWTMANGKYEFVGEAGMRKPIEVQAKDLCAVIKAKLFASQTKHFTQYGMKSIYKRTKLHEDKYLTQELWNRPCLLLWVPNMRDLLLTKKFPFPVAKANAKNDKPDKKRKTALSTPSKDGKKRKTAEKLPEFVRPENTDKSAEKAELAKMKKAKADTTEEKSTINLNSKESDTEGSQIDSFNEADGDDGSQF